MADNMNALAPVSSLPNKDEWGTIFGMAEQLVPTGFLPKAVDTPQKAAAIMLKGRELGVPPMYALSNITVIQGKPTANAEMMLALVKRAYGRDAVWVETSTPKIAKIGYLVHSKPRFYEYTIEMAKQAGLLSNQTWTKFPDAMLRARAISAVCRMEFPEVIGGMYAPGELGEDVRVDESTGEVISVDYAPREVRQQAKPETVEMPVSDDEDELWAVANRYFHTVINKYDITDDEKHAFVRYGGVESGSTRDMNSAQLRKAANFIDSKEDPKAFMAGIAEMMAKKDEQQQDLAAIGEAVSAEFDAQQADK